MLISISLSARKSNIFCYINHKKKRINFNKEFFFLSSEKISVYNHRNYFKKHLFFQI